MMFERGQRLRNDGVSTARKMDNCGEVVFEFVVARLTRVGRGVHGLRLADGTEIPASQVEEMNGLFEDPTADTFDVVSPVVGAQPIRAPRQFDNHVLWLTDVAARN